MNRGLDDFLRIAADVGADQPCDRPLLPNGADEVGGGLEGASQRQIPEVREIEARLPVEPVELDQLLGCRKTCVEQDVDDRPPRMSLPLGRALEPIGLPPNLREVVSASDGVTYWATDARARVELGYQSRTLEDGMLDLYAAEHASGGAHGTVRQGL